MNGLTLQQIARALGGEVHGDHVLAPGPGHSAKDRSLSIKLTPGAPDDFIVHSFAGDDWTACKDYVRQRVGVPERDDRPRPDYDPLAAMNARARAHTNGRSHPNGEPPKQPKHFNDYYLTSKGYRLTNEYHYTEEDGELLYQVLRYEHQTEEKKFLQRRPDGNGGWFGDAGGRKVIYRWPDLKRRAHNTMFVCEGEKDADRLASLGFLATTVASGAWSQEAIEALRGYQCFIMEDNDDPGRKRAREAAEALYGCAENVQIVKLPGLLHKQDVSDWVDDKSSDPDGLIELCLRFKIWEPEKEGSDNTSSEKKNEHAEEDEWDQSGDACPPAGMDEIMATEFAPIAWVVPGVLVEGVTLLAAKPKVGKSWLLLHAAHAVSVGGFTLGELHCPEGDVLYCALEDNQRRLKSRMFKMFGQGAKGSPRLKVFCEFHKLAEGGIDRIKDWIESVESPQMIVIDTLSMVRVSMKRNDTQFQADYDAVKDLRTLAAKYHVAIVLVHHLRKADADDPFDTVNATLGLTASVDSILIIRRDASGTFTLHGRGRDLTGLEKAIAFNKGNCTWAIMGEAGEVTISADRAAIIAALEEAGEDMTLVEITAATGIRGVKLRLLLGRMAKDGTICKAARGRYSAAGKG